MALNKLKSVLDNNYGITIQEKKQDINRIINLISIINECENHIENDTKIILKEILYDLEIGLYSCVNTLYRNAYVCLRSAIELSLGYIYFLDHYYNYLFWKKDEFDLTWSQIKDEKNGILRQSYLSLFAEDDYSLFIDNYKKLYHECSQSVHGKYQYMFSIQTGELKFSDDMFDKYIKMEENVIKLIISILLIRHTELYKKVNEKYHQEINDILNYQKLRNLLKIIKGENENEDYYF